MQKTIYFDMDGTIANLYMVENWLPMLRASNPTPYLQAKPMLNMSAFARLLHKAQRLGYKIAIVSWLSKGSSAEYSSAVALAKMQWLMEHLPSVIFDEIKIIEYGIPKSTVVNDTEGILFDDEEQNRQEWKGVALEPEDILYYLRWLI